MSYLILKVYTVKHRFPGKGFSPDFSKKFKNNPKIRYPGHEKPIPPFAFYKLHIFVISFVNFVKLRINLNFILVKMDIEEEIIKTFTKFPHQRKNTKHVTLGITGRGALTRKPKTL